MPWHKLQIEGVSRIKREVARFVVEPIRDDLPMAFRVKIVEEQDGLFYGYPEIAILDATGTPDFTSGRGATIEEALSDTVKYLLKTLEGKPQISPDAIWWNPRF